MMCRALQAVAIVATVAGTAGAAPAPEPAPNQAEPPPASAGTEPTATEPPSATSTAVASEAAKISELDKLRTPASPAFVILGAAPTEIQHPTTPRALAVALGGDLTGGSLAIPKGVAIEVAPYWLMRHPDLTVGDYRRQALLRPLRTLSVSVGTTQTQRAQDTGAGATIQHTDANIGLGVRTMLYQGGDDDACTQKARELGIAVSAAMLLAEAEQKAARDAAEAELKKLHNDTCLALAAATAGLSIDLAAAVDIHADDAKLTKAGTRLAGYAVWTNVAYDTHGFSGIAVARLGGRKDAMSSDTVFDGGLRAMYKQKTYAVSAEALVRHRFTSVPDSTTYKLDLAVEYLMTDDTWLSVTLGRDFATAPGETGSWFSLTNLQWSFGKSILR
jgi:hypothetical protein